MHIKVQVIKKKIQVKKIKILYLLLVFFCSYQKDIKYNIITYNKNLQ
jgi:hypothetical protein